MPVRVEHPVLGIVELPDGTTQEEVEQRLLQIGAATMPEESSGSVFFNQLGEGLESSIEGLSQLSGLDFYTDSYEDEFRNRVELEQSPYAGYGGLVVGSILDPVTLPAAFLKPIAIGGKLTTGIARGSVAGAAGGVVEPVFEQFDDSRLLNTTVGTVFGGALGGALSKFIARDVVPPTKQEADDGAEAAIESVAEAVEPTPVRTPQETVQEELTASSKLGLTPDAEASLQKGIDERLKRVEQIEKASAKRTKGLRATDDKAAGDAAVQRFEEIRQRLMGEVREMRLRLKKGVEGRAAGVDLAKLRTGQLDQLSPATQTRLQELESTPEPTVRPVEQTAQPAPEVTQTPEAPVTPRQPDVAEEAPQEFAPLRMGTEARESAGSAGVRPEQQFAGQAAEGVATEDMVASAWSRKNVEPAASKGFEESDADLQRAAMRESAASERLTDLMGHKFGSYTFKDNPELEAETKSLIGEDYDSIVEWLMDSARKGRVFNAQEQRILEPLRAEAEQRIRASYKAMREMRRQGGFSSKDSFTQEEYDAVMELQFYSYVADAIDTNGTRASHALKEIQNIKAKRKINAGKIKAGKPIDDIFGVKC
jgi:hypothetical protein